MKNPHDETTAAIGLLEARARPCAPPAATRSGYGRIEVERVGGRTALTRTRAESPLRLLAPQTFSPAAWAFTSTFGGGLVSGDSIYLDVRVGPGAALALSTQSSNKVYRSLEGQTTGQRLDAVVHDDATLVVAPDPVVCFAGSRYAQHQRVELHPKASLVLLDWVSAGRVAGGERWAFERALFRTEIIRNSRPMMDDRLLLDTDDGAMDTPFRTGRHTAIATVVIVGPQFEQTAAALRAEIDRWPVDHPPSHLFVVASPLADGVVVRALADSTERLGRYIRSSLSFVIPALGFDPWARKW